MGDYDELPDGVVVADDNGCVAVFNAAAGELTGIDPRDALGKDIADALPLEDQDGRPWWACTAPYTGLRIRTGHRERNLLLPDGREVLVTAAYVRDRESDGQPVVRVVVGLRDTEARTRLERGRADLVATVAHELRSPLTSVKGFTATLIAKWERFTDAQRRLMLETVNADADRVTRLITELLDIARIDSGRLEVRRQVVDVPGAVRRQVEGSVSAGAPATRFSVEVRGRLPEMWVDADKLDQVLANLVENAVRHGDGLVRILVEPDGDGAAVTVSDEGEGISLEHAGRVFTKFWRSGRRGGTGLGLYIVRGLVEAHGGSVTLGRAPSGGAVFRFVLPAGTPDFAS